MSTPMDTLIGDMGRWGAVNGSCRNRDGAVARGAGGALLVPVTVGRWVKNRRLAR